MLNFVLLAGLTSANEDVSSLLQGSKVSSSGRRRFSTTTSYSSCWDACQACSGFCIAYPEESGGTTTWTATQTTIWPWTSIPDSGGSSGELGCGTGCSLELDEEGEEGDLLEVNSSRGASSLEKSNISKQNSNSSKEPPNAIKKSRKPSKAISSTIRERLSKVKRNSIYTSCHEACDACGVGCTVHVGHGAGGNIWISMLSSISDLLQDEGYRCDINNCADLEEQEGELLQINNGHLATSEDTTDDSMKTTHNSKEISNIQPFEYFQGDSCQDACDDCEADLGWGSCRAKLHSGSWMAMSYFFITDGYNCADGACPN